MQLEMKELDALAEKLNLSKDEMLRESLKFFLERKLREIKTEIFKIRTKYGVSSVEEFEELYRKGEVEEKDTWQDLQKLDHLEFKKDELEEVLRTL
ncbi:MAG: ribbon-helix-helix protein, CopG family [Candidatus Brocadia sp.]|nr:ribbon-helix-helix protein, CopG family [Candidatus Brocadia sp.]